MPVVKKLPIADIMARVQNSIAARSDVDRIPDTPFEGQLNRHLEEVSRFRRVVLPPDTRIAFVKRLVLRVMKVYTRYAEIFNYNVSEVLFKLNSKVNYIANRQERRVAENAEAIAELARSVEEIRRVLAAAGLPDSARPAPPGQPGVEGFDAVAESIVGVLSDPMPRIENPQSEQDVRFNQAMDRLDQLLACCRDYLSVTRKR